MKMNFAPGLLLLAVTVALAAPPEVIQRVTLDERVVITVAVSTNRVTTISSPGPIAAIDALGVTADGKTPGQGRPTARQAQGERMGRIEQANAAP